MKMNIFAQAKSLSPVTLAAALEYQDNMEKMRLQVDQELSKQPDILDLIGGSLIEMMKENHRCHVSFMATVFRLNTYSLLPKIIVWVYRSYHNHGFNYSYFPVELLAWQKAVSSRLSAAAAAEINRIYQWMIDSHLDFIQLAESDSYATFSSTFDGHKPMQIFLTHMLNNNYRASLEMAVETVHSVESLAAFYQEVMTPVLYEIGRLWEDGEISAVQEHMATAISMRIMSAMYGGFVVGETTKGKAVVTSAPSEYHDVGARMVSDLLEMDGWQVDYLGANSPAADLLALLRQDPPFLLGLSVVMPFNMAEVQRLIDTIRKQSELKAVKILIGGPALTMEPGLWRKIGADGYAVEAGQAVQLARQWWEERTGK